MREPTVQRRLAAILAADVVGYTRLMEEDTDSTVAAWQAAREDVIKPQVGAHSGNIIKLTGDGFLAEFSSAQEAVNCAIAMQTNLSSNNLVFRMGIDLGDIIDDGEDIHGEGVNLASRLEGLALPIRLSPTPTICSVSPWTAGKGRRRRIEEAIRLILDCSENRTGV